MVHIPCINFFDVSLGFSATGQYEIEVSIEAGFLSKALKVVSTQALNCYS